MCLSAENVFSLTAHGTWRHISLLDYQIQQPISEKVIFHLHSMEVIPTIVTFCDSPLLKLCSETWMLYNASYLYFIDLFLPFPFANVISIAKCG